MVMVTVTKYEEPGPPLISLSPKIIIGPNTEQEGSLIIITIIITTITSIELCYVPSNVLSSSPVLF